MSNGYYSKELEMPTSKKEGLMNFIQMIINQAEAGNTNEALLIAVDLLEDVRCGCFDNVETGATIQTMHSELSAKFESEKDGIREGAYRSGREAMRAEILQKLGLAA